MKNILKYYFLIVGFLTTIFMVLFVLFVFGLVKNIGKISSYLAIEEKSLGDKPYYLEIDLVGSIKDREDSEIERVLKFIEGKKEFKLIDLIDTIDIASKDDRIKGLVIKRLSAKAGLSTVLELNEAFHRFRNQGKQIYVFMHEADNKNYLLASAADKIFLQQEGSLYVPGISASFLYLKDTLAKVGVEAEFLQKGKYKSAPEIFTANAMSDDIRIMTTSLLGDLQGTFISAIAGNRGITLSEVTDFLDKGLISSHEALGRNLVDDLVYRDEFQEIIDEKFTSIEPIDFSLYSEIGFKSVKGLKRDKKNKIGLIIASGPIQMSARDHQWDEPVILPHKLVKKLQELEKDSSIKALILRVNSPGGSALASDIIWNGVNKLNLKKPVYVSMGSVAASGGYYISMGAEKIYANKATITGSIGVFGGKFVINKLLNKIEAHPESISFGEGASLFSVKKNFTPQQRHQVQTYINHVYHSFVTKASLGRNMNYEDLDAVAQGKVWTGRQALEVGLVDGLGGYYQVIQKIKEDLGLAKEIIPSIIHIQLDTGTFLDKLRFFSLSIKTKLLSSFFEHPFSEKEKEMEIFAGIKSLLTNERALYLMPFQLTLD